MEYITMTCDIRQSNRLENREAVQMLLIDTLKEVNRVFARSVASPFIITLGDECRDCCMGIAITMRLSHLSGKECRKSVFVQELELGKSPYIILS